MFVCFLQTLFILYYFSLVKVLFSFFFLYLAYTFARVGGAIYIHRN